ncbi:MAG: sulfatase-like hydrolase/transferase [Paludibacteraceae bacterium]|nr:sulfatase-like hydrolase/transferase [Paludibacteraceae bacterium]
MNTAKQHIPIKGISKALWNHPWTIAACNLLLVMTLYSLSRLAFYVYNLYLFPSVEASHLGEMMGGGIRFDLTAVLYLSSLYLVMMMLPLPCKWRNNATYQTVCKWVFIIPNLIGLTVNCIDMVYVRFTDRRLSITFFSEFNNDDNLLSIFLQSVVQYWPVTLFAIAVCLITVIASRSRKPFRIEASKPWIYYMKETALLLASVYFVVIGIRGGFGAYTRPITMSNALQYTNRPQETLIVLNTPFSIMRSTDATVYHNPHFFSEEELANRMTPEHPICNRRPSDKLNVVVIILESFSKEYIGYFNHDLDNGTYNGYTPYLDSLLPHCITYTHSFASGRKSIDAMPSVLSSIPMLLEPYIVTPYSTNKVMSLASCLGEWGYTTAFFHGAPNGSMGFEAYARSAGFDSYYGMDEYKQATGTGERDFDGTWAIWDEEFLQYYAIKMSEMREPFMTSVFTASSHHPFKVPARYEGVYPEGTQPIHHCVGYSDNALRQFFATAARQPWFIHTLFVLTADHTNQLTHDEYRNSKGLYEVPIAFYCPSWETGKTDSTQVVSQTDIMPSVLGYLGYDRPYFAFGEDVLTQEKTHNYAVCYNHPMVQLLTDSLLIEYDGVDGTNYYNYQEDPLLLHGQETRGEMETEMDYLKAYIQQYISRMIDNRLTYGDVED